MNFCAQNAKVTLLTVFLKSVEHSQGRIVVFSTEFEPGRKLDSLGGIAALLRFKVA